MKPPDNALIHFFDGKSIIHILDRIQPNLSLAVARTRASHIRLKT